MSRSTPGTQQENRQPQATRLPHTFRSLRHPNYRVLLAAQVLTSSAMGMEQVARGWLVYSLTGSALLLGLVQATRMIPLLFLGAFSGVAADRFNRQFQLMAAQLANAALNIVLAGLILTGTVETWHIFLTGFLGGCAITFQMPARQSLIPSTVNREDLINAVAINSGVNNMTRTLGPSLAGLLIAGTGTAGAYLFQAGLLVVASVWTLQLKFPQMLHDAPGKAKESMWSSLVDGLRYVRNRPVILNVLVLGLIPIILAQPYQALVPIFAGDIFDIGPAGLGLLMSAPGVGAVIGALLVARQNDSSRNAHLFLGGIIGFGGGIVVFALSPWVSLALIAMFFVGITSTSYRAVNQTMLQAHTENAYLGRVMSLYLLDRGFSPLGAALAGVLAAAFDVRIALTIMGGLTVAVAILAAFRGLSLNAPPETESVPAR